jgi:DnaJ-domain-containing protein 1
MTYNLRTDKTAEETMREMWRAFEQWPDADLIHARELKDGAHTAEVYFEFRGTPVRIHYGQQWRYAGNLRAVYLTLDALRLAYKRGLGDILTETVSQMLQLGAGARTRDPYEVLGVRPEAADEVIEASYRALARNAHPDAGGTDDAMKELNDAIGRIRDERRKVQR